MEVSGRVRSTQLVIPQQATDNDHKPLPPRQVFLLDVESVNDGAVSITGRAIVYWAHPGALVYPGDYVSLAGKGSVALGNVNPGVRGYEDYLRNWGIHSGLECAGADAVTVTAQATRLSPGYWAARFRQAQADRLALVMPERVLDFVYAVWLGQQSVLGYREYRSYVASGTAHILSVSGVHAGIVFLTLNFALRAMQVRRRARAIAAMAGVLSFALVSGASIPAMRAAAMVCLYLSADLFEREPDTQTALSISGIAFLLWDPRCVFDTGFLLSYASVASILIFHPLILQRLTWVHRIIRPTISTSLAVQIVPLPIAAGSFHVIALAAPVANMAAIPLLAVVLWLCSVTTVLSFVWMPAAQLIGYATWAPIELIRLTAILGASLKPVSPALTSPTPLACALYWSAAAGLATLASVRLKRRRATMAITAGLFVAAMIAWRPHYNMPEVVHLDVGNADAAFLHMPTGERLLIDGGMRSDRGDAGQQIVGPFLWSRGVTHLDAIMVSHADADHIGGLISIVDDFDVDVAILGIVPSDKLFERMLLERCAARGTRVLRVQRGDTVNVGKTRLTILHPSPKWNDPSTVNNSSIVFKTAFGKDQLLFTGDIEGPAEADIEKGALDADLLKVPHHGSNTSSTPEFIGAISPKFAVISAASRGRHVMDEEIVRRYEAKKIPVLRTDRFGAVRFWLDGELTRVELAREARGYPIAAD